MRGFVVVALLVGCAFDPHRHIRPARLTVGASSHHFSSATPQPATARTTTPPPAPTLPHDAVAMSAQFAMMLHSHFYLGGEVEAGELETPGSNVAGGFLVIGGEGSSHFGSLAVEVATGSRSLRYRLGAKDVVDTIVEPRVRAYLWLNSQVTLGAAAGATLGDLGWMVGAYVGVHSNLFDVFGPPQ